MSCRMTMHYWIRRSDPLQRYVCIITPKRSQHDPRDDRERAEFAEKLVCADCGKVKLKRVGWWHLMPHLRDELIRLAE